MSIPINPFGKQKSVIHDAKNVNMFDDKMTKLKKRKTELETKANRTKEESAELEEINKEIKQQRDKEFFSKRIF